MPSITKDQERLLRVIREHEISKGERPLGRYLFMLLRREGIDYESVRRPIPTRLLLLEDGGSENERLGLALDGIAYLNDDSVIVQAFLELLRLTCQRFREQPKDTLRVTHEDLRKACGPADERTYLRTLDIVKREFGGTYGQSTWSKQVDISDLRYEAVSSIEEYFRTRDDVEIKEVMILETHHIELLSISAIEWKRSGRWISFLELILSGDAPKTIRHLRQIPSAYMEKYQLHHNPDTPMRLTLEGLALTSTVENILVDLAKAVSLVAAQYEETFGAATPTTEELAALSNVSELRAQQIAYLLEWTYFLGIRIDRSKQPWVLKPEPLVLEHLGVSNFEDLYRRIIQATRKAHNMPDITAELIRRTLFELFSKLDPNDTKGINRINIVGQPYQTGELENALKERFTPEERALAGRVIRELEAQSILIPTYRDLAAPEDWLVLTTGGRAAVGQSNKPAAESPSLISTKFDAFLCHASEDKAAIVTPFSKLMIEAGLRPWLDAGEISWGDKILRKIQDGLTQSKFVVVFLSDKFLEKPWPETELEAALNLEIGNKKKVLPLLLGITHADLEARYPIVAAKHYKTVHPYDRSKVVDAPYLKDLLKSLGDELAKA